MTSKQGRGGAGKAEPPDELKAHMERNAQVVQRMAAWIKSANSRILDRPVLTPSQLVAAQNARVVRTPRSSR